MPYALLLAGSLILLPLPAAAASSLNKCIEANGSVTYSNLPCKNALQAHKLEIDPPPQPDPVRSPAKAQAVKSERTAPIPGEIPKEPKAETRRSPGQSAAQAHAGKCNAIAEKLGRVLDKMDTARRQGYTQAQMDDWNQQVRDHERQKQQAGCF